MSTAGASAASHRATMPVIAAFIATSLDGFIARSDGSLDWLDEANALVPPGDDCGYAAFIAGIDAVVLGRRSFEVVSAFAEWPYGSTPVYVLSRSLPALPGHAPATVTLASGAPSEIAHLLAERGHKRIYLDGGVAIQGFLAAGLIAEITVTTIPILLGAGRPLFGPLEHDVQLEHLSTHAYPFGFVQSRYAVRGAATAGHPGGPECAACS